MPSICPLVLLSARHITSLSLPSGAVPLARPQEMYAFTLSCTKVGIKKVDLVPDVSEQTNKSIHESAC